jgi:hypothetical protein
MLALSAAAAAAGVAEAPGAEDVVRALGIMVGDENGNMDLGGSVTRAQFCKMMTVASPYKDSAATASGYSMFSDLRSSHWSYGYVTVAVSNGWFVGYVDGTFKPDNTILLEEAATALLRLLGYGKADMPGAYPSAQLGRAEGLGLLKGISASPGEALTRRDAMTVFYNLLTASAKDGAAYAEKLGYKLDGAGDIDYNGVVASGIKGPFVLRGGSGLVSVLPFNTSNITVYRNGAPSDYSVAGSYDVCYYNENIRAVWLYSKRVTGVLDAVTPSVSSPSAVTVSGTSYAIGASSAAYKVSASGSLRAGDTVTLLLGMDDVAADIMPASELQYTYYGVVVKKTTGVQSGSGNSSAAGYTVTVACTDGVERSFTAASSYIDVGQIVQGSYGDSGFTAKAVSPVGASGAVDKNATKLGDTPFADDVEILDTNGRGGYKTIPPSRLGGATLSRSDIRLCLLDDGGEVSRLILNNVTGDLEDYVLLTSVSEEVSETSMSVSGAYGYLRDGAPGTVSGSTVYFIKHGGAVLQYDSKNAVSRISNLTELTPESADERSLTAGGRVFYYDDDVQVYIRSGQDYFLVGIDSVTDTSQYSLRAWYDNLNRPAGGRVRVILATKI